MKEYKIGDLVWLVRAGSLHVKETCPICYGKTKVTIILGNGDYIETDCNFCDKTDHNNGFRPTGYVQDWDYISDPLPLIVDKVLMEETENGVVKKDYRAGNYILSEDKICDTKEEAYEKGLILVEEAKELNYNRNNYAQKQAQNALSWAAGYHLREANKLKKQIAYHEGKTQYFKAKQKEEHK